MYPLTFKLGDQTLEVIPCMMQSYREIIRKYLDTIGELAKAMTMPGFSFMFHKERYYVINGHIYGIIDYPAGMRYGKESYIQKAAYVGKL